jgi:hypothetical protein
MKLIAKPDSSDTYITKKVRCMDDMGQYDNCRLIYNADGDYYDSYCDGSALFEPTHAWLEDDWVDIYEIEIEFL